MPPDPTACRHASSNCSTSAICSSAGPASFRAASASASRSAARCLMRPRLLLLDEPLASLDAARKREILPYLERLRDEAHVPMIYVSHHAAEVRRIATSVVRHRGWSRCRKLGGVELLDAAHADVLA